MNSFIYSYTICQISVFTFLSLTFVNLNGCLQFVFLPELQTVALRKAFGLVLHALTGRCSLGTLMF